MNLENEEILNVEQRLVPGKKAVRIYCGNPDNQNVPNVGQR